MKIIAFTNQKGGVGKTTTVLNIGAGFTAKGKKVLLVDLDPQGHLTYSYGKEAHNLEYTIYDVFTDSNLDPNEIIIKDKDYHLIPSNLNLSGADMELSNLPGREFLLKELLSDLEEKYDYVLLDCPPNLGLLTLNALVATNNVYIPLQAEFLAMQGISHLLKTIEVVRKRLNKNVDVSGIIITMYNSRINLSKEIIEKVEGYFADKIFKTFIRSNVSLAEAPSFGKSIFDYKPTSNGARDYEKLCDEIIEREEK